MDVMGMNRRKNINGTPGLSMRASRRTRLHRSTSELRRDLLQKTRSLRGLRSLRMRIRSAERCVCGGGIHQRPEKGGGSLCVDII